MKKYVKVFLKIQIFYYTLIFTINIMANQETILLYRSEKLLILHWKMIAPLSNKFDFLLNNQVLAKPFLAVQMENVLDMMIIIDARQYKLTARKNILTLQDKETDTPYISIKQGTITLLPKKLIATYRPEIQARFFTRLFLHTQQNFKNLGEKWLESVFKRYTYPIKNAYQLSEHLFFICLPWSITAENTPLSLGYSYLEKNKLSKPEEQQGLYLDGFLYAFLKVPDLTEQYGLLSYSTLANIPIRFKQIAQSSREEILEQLAKQTSNVTLLQEFLFDESQAIAVQEQAIIKKERTPVTTLKGKVLGIKKQAIIGWAINEAEVSQAVLLDVYQGDKKITSIIADKDCHSLGLEQNLGQCAFALPLTKEHLQGDNKQLTLVYAETQEPVSGSPIKLGDGRFDFSLSIENATTVKVVFQQRTLSNAAFTLRLLLDNTVLSETQGRGGQAFELIEHLPAHAFDSHRHLLQLTISDAQNKLLYTCLRKVQHHYQGGLEQVGYRMIRGWLINTDFPEYKATLEVNINDECIGTVVCHLERTEIQQKLNLPTAKLGFEFQLPERYLLEPYLTIALYYKDSTMPVFPQQAIVTAKDTMIRSLINAAHYLKSETDKTGTANTNDWARLQIIEPAIKALRAQAGIPSTIQLGLTQKVTQALLDKPQSPIIDIIIPVYQGYDETLQCIHSVLQAKNKTSMQLHVINDCSPDGRLKYTLQSMAKEQVFNLIENDENLGFVATVNKGMRLNTNRDVVLLNADTVVTDNWLDHLLRASQKNQSIATVTPFSNNATICSFPDFNQDNKLPENISLQALNALFQQNNPEKMIEIPTAVGFCMFIKRTALLDVGYFDEQTWNKGYGEENDFCLRASSLGWRHVLACDVFVQHHGAVSFAASKTAHIERNLAVLNKMYPDYPVSIRRFIQQDPIASARNTVIKTLLQQQADDFFLFIMHDLGGGTKAHGDHLAQLLEAQGTAVLELSVLKSGKWCLRSAESNYAMIYEASDEAQLLTDLKALNIQRIHFHQTLGFPNSIWQLPETLGVAYDVTTHDFMPICPRINLIDETGKYCQQSQFYTDKCQRCIQLNGVPSVEIEPHLKAFSGSVQQWRNYYQQQLVGAENIFCPSQSTAKLYQQHFDLTSIRVQAHPEKSFTFSSPSTLKKQETLSIAVIGAIGDHKGYQTLLACAKNALKEGLALHFVIIGYTKDDAELNKLDNVSITGAYSDDTQLNQLIQQYKCKIALFLSVWPETYCYTLTEALRNNLYPVALNYGAIAERLSALRYGDIMVEQLQPEAINTALLTTGKSFTNPIKTMKYKGTQYKKLLQDYYHL